MHTSAGMHHPIASQYGNIGVAAFLGNTTATPLPGMLLLPLMLPLIKLLAKPSNTTSLHR